MKTTNNQNAYNNELVALIKSGLTPKEAKEIADSHFGNYEKVVNQIAEERKKSNKKTSIEENQDIEL
jgi:hypothetical protein